MSVYLPVISVAEVQQVRALVHAGPNSSNPAGPSRSRPSKSDSSKLRRAVVQRASPSPGALTNTSPRSGTGAARAKSTTTVSAVPGKPNDRSPGRVSYRGSEAPRVTDWTSTGQLTSEAELLLSLDKTCIFCGERNELFTEEGLDLHYWKDCPMLHRCANCKQVVEIAGMVEHLLHECEAAPPGHYVRCSRCSEAILHSEIDTHPCFPTVAVGAQLESHIRCPLCHTDLPLVCPGTATSNAIAPGGPEDVWKSHLLGGDQSELPQCTHNPRRPARTQQQAIHITTNSNKSSNVLSKPTRLSTSPRPTANRRSPPPKLAAGPTGSTKHPGDYLIILCTFSQKSGIPRPTHPTHVRPV
ncbi:unnamed protein product [Echinostoma caproni]|uniref:LIM zinc-binding domain-containing protein n=1 Tax=Echinostoma caproni TaxID=27848 RepID=A0A183ATQ1_9TREM|nr:unnamed protein product [Echinostoma caproni]